MSEQSFSTGAGRAHGHHRAGAVERLATGVLGAIRHALYAEELAARPGLLQRLDPRVKVIGLMALVVACVAARGLTQLGALFVFAVGLALVSRIPLVRVMLRTWISVLLFTGPLAVPALFLTAGDAIAHLPVLEWSVSHQGALTAALLVSRSLSAMSFAALLVLCTPWTHVLKALRVLGVPAVLIVILGMTHRYILLFLKTAQDMFEARQSRLLGPLSGGDARRIATGSAAVLLAKSYHLSSEIHLAMLARGYQGDDVTLHAFHIRVSDWLALFAVATIILGVFRFA